MISPQRGCVSEKIYMESPLCIKENGDLHLVVTGRYDVLSCLSLLGLHPTTPNGVIGLFLC